MVRTLHFHCQGAGWTPGQGTKISQAVPCGQKKKKKKPFQTSHSYFYIGTVIALRNSECMITVAVCKWHTCYGCQNLIHVLGWGR